MSKKPDCTEYHISLYSENEEEMNQKAMLISKALGQRVEVEKLIRCGVCRDTFYPEDMADHKFHTHGYP